MRAILFNDAFIDPRNEASNRTFLRHALRLSVAHPCHEAIPTPQISVTAIGPDDFTLTQTSKLRAPDTMFLDPHISA